MTVHYEKAFAEQWITGPGRRGPEGKDLVSNTATWTGEEEKETYTSLQGRCPFSAVL